LARKLNDVILPERMIVTAYALTRLVAGFFTQVADEHSNDTIEAAYIEWSERVLERIRLTVDDVRRRSERSPEPKD
jgi:hypothetical protein